MPLKTTCIGAYPKPDFVRLPDWFNHPEGPDTANPTQRWQAAMERLGADAEAIIQRGIQQAVEDQVACGVDIPTDGEIIRENYIHYHCRHLNGFDFTNLTNREVRGGTYRANLPTIAGPVSLREPYIARDWKIAQSFTDRPLKITLPGPLTVADTNADAYYHDGRKLGQDLAAALNREILSLAEAGCVHIQVDEPVFARQPDNALAFGFENLERAFHGCPDTVVKTVHMCCGYPDRLDALNYPKAEPSAYHQIADAIEDSCIDVVSIEDAHRYNELSLLEHFSRTQVILGVVAVAKSEVESVEQISERIAAALHHIDKHRLIVAPDCGLGLLGRELAMQKLRNLCAAARAVA